MCKSLGFSRCCSFVFNKKHVTFNLSHIWMQRVILYLRRRKLSSYGLQVTKYRVIKENMSNWGWFNTKFLSQLLFVLMFIVYLLVYFILVLNSCNLLLFVDVFSKMLGRLKMQKKNTFKIDVCCLNFRMLNTQHKENMKTWEIEGESSPVSFTTTIYFVLSLTSKMLNSLTTCTKKFAFRLCNNSLDIRHGRRKFGGKQ